MAHACPREDRLDFTFCRIAAHSFGVEIVEDVREDHEIEVVSPIDDERVSRDRAVSVPDASVPRVGRRQLENVRPIHSRYDRFWKRPRHLDPVEPVPGCDVQHSGRRRRADLRSWEAARLAVTRAIGVAAFA